MRRALGFGIVALAVLAGVHAAHAATLRVGWCARTVTSAAAPFAIANKMGWFKAAGFDVEVVPLAGSTDCVKYVGTGEVLYALPSIEPLASLRPQGVLAKVYYTAYQGNIYGPAVAVDSPIKATGPRRRRNGNVGSCRGGADPACVKPSTNMSGHM